MDWPAHLGQRRTLQVGALVRDRCERAGARVNGWLCPQARSVPAGHTQRSLHLSSTLLLTGCMALKDEVMCLWPSFSYLKVAVVRPVSLAWHS